MTMTAEQARAYAREAEQVSYLAVQEALLRHKLMGQWVVIARNGQPVRIPPWEIEIDASVLDPEKQDMARRADIMWADKRPA